MKHLFRILPFLFIPFHLVASESSDACSLILEEVTYLRDKTIMRQMGKTAIDSHIFWDMLSPEDGIKQLDSCEENTVAFTPPPPREEKLKASEINKAVRESTLVVGQLYNCGKCEKVHFKFSNTAFVLSEDGLVVLNHHCLAGFKNPENARGQMIGLVVRTWDGEVYPVSSILAGSVVQDLGIIQVALPEDKTLTPIPLGESAEVGDDVFTLSHPNSMLYRFSRGMVTRNTVEQPYGHGSKADKVRMCISADYGVGSSGGPVLDEYANLVGIISSTRTVYAKPGKDPKSPQMVDKQTIPVASLRQLLTPGNNPSASDQTKTDRKRPPGLR